MDNCDILNQSTLSGLNENEAEATCCQKKLVILEESRVSWCYLYPSG